MDDLWNSPMPGHYILVDGKVVPAKSLREWAEFFQDFDNRVISRSQVGPYLVSTVFLGLDHSFDPYGDPVVFETMIFSGPEHEDIYQERYSDLEAAMWGHEKAVAQAQALYLQSKGG